jgi:hypothetical protein
MSNATIAKLIAVMHKYQKDNNIKNECIANTQYLYDSLKSSFPDIQAKARAVIAFRHVEKELGVIDGKMNVHFDDYFIIHMCVDIGNDKLVDPSQDINDLPNVTYIGYDIVNFMKKVRSWGHDEEQIKKIIKQYVEFIKYAERINDGEMLYANKKYYNEQADYVESNFYAQSSGRAFVPPS